MLTKRHAQQGFSLVELMIGVIIMAILLSVAAPSFRSWVQNGQISTSAEAIQNGLQLARGEAVRLNTLVQFVLGAASSWSVGCTTPAADCPATIQSRSSTEGSPNAVVVASEVVTATGAAAVAPVFTGTVTFNGLGRVVTTGAAASIAIGNQVNIDVSNPTGGVCAPAGPMKCMRLIVPAGGQVRMCDPARQRATDPRGC